MTYRSLLVMLVLLGVALVVSCAGPTAAPTSAPTPATAPTTALTQAAVATTVPTQATAPTSPPATATQPTKPTVPSATATQPAKPTVPPASPTTAAASKPGTFGKAELDKIFPPGKGQDLVFQACVNCHNWVPLVLAGFDKGAWEQNKMNHRERVTSLSDEEFKYLYEYLAANFNPSKPVPTNIPKDLLDAWTSY